MAALFLNGEYYATHYNCSQLTAEQIDESGMKWPLFGLYFVAFGVIAMVMYVPCLFAMLHHKFFQHACYKIMFYMGMFDLMCLYTNSLATGVLMMLGGTFCKYPKTIYFSGMIGLGAWMNCTACCLLLACNRCANMFNIQWLRKPFGAQMTIPWLVLCTLYFLYVVTFESPALFNSDLVGWFFDPFISSDNSATFAEYYQSRAHQINNVIGSVAIPVVYTVICIMFATLARFKEDITRETRSVFIQSFLLCFFHCLASSIYVLMQYSFLQPSRWLIVGAAISWQFAHSCACFFYYTINASLRDEILALPGIRRVSGRKERTSSVAQVVLFSCGPIIAIDDVSATSYSSEEKKLRCELASLYRLMEAFHWSQTIYNHITVRLPGTEQILINPYGLQYSEITASSLVKMHVDGTLIDAGATNLGVNAAGYVLHSAVHECRRDVECIIHAHTPAATAVSAMKCGVLPISQEAILIGEVAYHDYQGIVNFDEEKPSLIADLGECNVMMLRNHGFMVCGRSVAHAFWLAYHLMLACEAQVRAVSGPRSAADNLIIPRPEAIARANNTGNQAGGGVIRSAGVDSTGQAIEWGQGELEWESWMRRMDHAGYRTGYAYKNNALYKK